MKKLSRWMIAAGLLAVFLGVLRPAGCPPHDDIDPQRNVVLILIDTLRADHLGLYGYRERQTSPNIDRMARRGIFFEKAWSTAPWTVPSIMSVMTSMYPELHGFNLEGDRYTSSVPILSPSIPTLAELLKSRGYRTLAVTGGGGVGRVYGFDRGFNRFFEPEIMTGEDVEQGVDRALKWLKSIGDQRFFLFFHTYEVHRPNTHAGFKGGASPQEQAIAAYDSDLVFADRHLKRLFEGLRRRADLEDTILVITADHGENLYDRVLGEHPVDHGHHLHDELLSVPLIFVAPGLIPAEGSIPTQVQLTDIMPTILSLVGVDPDELRLQGKNLRGLLQGRSSEPGDRPIFGSAPLQGPRWHSLRWRGAKLILSPRVEGTNWWNDIDQPTRALYLLESDPFETENVLEADAAIAGDLQVILDRHLDACAERRQNLGPVDFAAVKDDAAGLEALGYVIPNE